VVVLRSESTGPARLTIPEALTSPLTGSTSQGVPVRLARDGEAYTAVIGDGTESITATSAGRALEAKDGRLSFAPPVASAQVGRTAFTVPELEGASVQLLADISMPEPPSGLLDRLRSRVLGTRPVPRGVLALSGERGHYAALTLSGSGDPIVLDLALQDRHLTTLESVELNAASGELRMELSVDKAGDLRAFVGEGRQRRPIGIPLALGAEWKKHFGKLPWPTLACLEGACQFRNLTWKVKREAAPEEVAPTTSAPVAAATEKPPVTAPTKPAQKTKKPTGKTSGPKRTSPKHR
jgi:eukaryotic-like serine/threonine-protein kinase